MEEINLLVVDSGVSKNVDGVEGDDVKDLDGAWNGVEGLDVVSSSVEGGQKRVHGSEAVSKDDVLVGEKRFTLTFETNVLHTVDETEPVGHDR